MSKERMFHGFRYNFGAEVSLNPTLINSFSDEIRKYADKVGKTVRREIVNNHAAYLVAFKKSFLRKKRIWIYEEYLVSI